MGMVSPLGMGVENNWKRLIAGESGISKIERIPVDEIDSKVAGQVPRGEAPGEFNENELFTRRERDRNDPFILYAMAATEEALEDAGWKPEEDEEKQQTGAIIGSGVGGFFTVTQGALDFAEKGAKGISPFFIPSLIINLAGAQVALKHGFQGPNYGVVSACATGADGIASCVRAIQLEEADVMIAGGADAAIHPVAIAGFCRAKAVSTRYNERPREASRPFDTERDGFIMAEGAGVLVLEEYEHARSRGATIYAEVLGYASINDAYHITATHPEGKGEQRALNIALKKAKITADDVDYVNAHATSTPVGDKGELNAMNAIFGKNQHIAISSTKSAVGHTLGAAGAIEAIYSICAINRGVVPPTLNLETIEPGFEHLNLVPKQAQEKSVKAAVSNAFGFGSSKVSLVFGGV